MRYRPGAVVSILRLPIALVVIVCSVGAVPTLVGIGFNLTFPPIFKLFVPAG